MLEIVEMKANKHINSRFSFLFFSGAVKMLGRKKNLHKLVLFALFKKNSIIPTQSRFLNIFATSSFSHSELSSQKGLYEI